MGGSGFEFCSGGRVGAGEDEAGAGGWTVGSGGGRGVPQFWHLRSGRAPLGRSLGRFALHLGHCSLLGKRQVPAGGNGIWQVPQRAWILPPSGCNGGSRVPHSKQNSSSRACGAMCGRGVTTGTGSTRGGGWSGGGSEGVEGAGQSTVVSRGGDARPNSQCGLGKGDGGGLQA